MLDPQTYRAGEQLAKTLIPHWRIAQTHNLDHFERVGFPVRIGSVREIGAIVDSMQENRFASYMAELGGISEEEYKLILQACRDSVRFQLTFLPHRRPVLPISTLMSVFVLYKKMLGVAEDFGSVLEIGPGCGYLSFFLRHHEALKNYSQIEACESFYILQNLVNAHCFGPRCDDRALPHEDSPALDVFARAGPVSEFSPKIRLSGHAPRSTHYPWWRIGELVSRDHSFDIVTSNANLLEFNPTALDDYLTLIHRVMAPGGVFIVQCTGFPANGNDEQLRKKLAAMGFAPLFFVQQGKPAACPREGADRLRDALSTGTLGSVTFNVTNALFVKAGHPLFSRYRGHEDLPLHFIAPEPVVLRTYFERPKPRRFPTVQQFVEDTEATLFN